MFSNEFFIKCDIFTTLNVYWKIPKISLFVFSMQIFKKTPNFHILLILLILFFTTSCGFIEKPDWSKPVEPNAKKRARENVKEGRGVSLGIGSRSKNDFLFASSNPLWRATLETIDFLPLSNVDYAGGLIITDWYSENNSNESIKIIIKFLTNEIRVDALDIEFFKKNCSASNNCSTTKIDSDLEFEMRDKILKRAALYAKDLQVIQRKNAPKKVYPGDNE